MLTLEQAQARILEALPPLGGESVSLSRAVGRVLAQPCSARRTLPPFDNSAMDGWAVRSADTQDASADSPRSLRVVGVIQAGTPSERKLEAGEAMRIFTGAPMPAGADAVIMQEHCSFDGDLTKSDPVQLLRPAGVGNHIRRAGEDIAAGAEFLSAGAVVGVGDVGMLSAQGHSWLQVRRAPRVAILPTGDEVMEIDLPLGPGQIPNSNSHLLAAMVEEAGGHPYRLAAAPDDPAALAQCVREARESADLVITCGGVSVGDFDYVRDVLEDAGQIDFWRVAIKPGKPIAFGDLGGTPMIGLPGNPVSAFVTFELFARPAIRHMAGHSQVLRPAIPVGLSCSWTPHAKRRELVRARLHREGGQLLATPASKQGSGQLSSLLGVDALLDIPAGEHTLPNGSQVSALLLTSAALVPESP